MVHIRYDTDGYWDLFHIGMQGHRRKRRMPNNTVQDIAPLIYLYVGVFREMRNHIAGESRKSLHVFLGFGITMCEPY